MGHQRHGRHGSCGERVRLGLSNACDTSNDVLGNEKKVNRCGVYFVKERESRNASVRWMKPTVEEQRLPLVLDEDARAANFLPSTERRDAHEVALLRDGHDRRRQLSLAAHPLVCFLSVVSSFASLTFQFPR